MVNDKSILIGCDNSSTLGTLFSVFKTNHHFSTTLTTASRISDLLSVLRTLDPDIIILNFRNNQLALNDLATFAKKNHIPVICLINKLESDNLKWDSHSIVFTYPVENIEEEDYLCNRINSVTALQNKKTPSPSSLADVALQTNNTNHVRDLSRYVMELDQKTELLSRIKNQITELYISTQDPVKQELQAILNNLKSSVSDVKLWDDFKLYFEKTNPEFLLLLAQKHPALSNRDIKYCCYLKMNMGNDDIKGLLGINQESVRTHKYRLKKKMDLPKDQDLSLYLKSFDQNASYIS